jgi:hypothetical protein
VPTKSVNAPALRRADATIDVSLNELIPNGIEKTRAILKVETVDASPKVPQVYCRATAATIEATICATRVKAFIHDEQKQKQIRKLLTIIKNCNDVVNRVAPSSSYSLVMADLMKRIDSWRQP